MTVIILITANPLFHMFNVLVPTGFVLVGQKNITNNNTIEIIQCITY